MKIVRIEWSEWEKEQFVVLFLILEKLKEIFEKILKSAFQVISFALFLVWIAGKILLSSPQNQLVRDEQWMFRHVK